MRTARRVFVSYQLRETPAAAHQLADELQRLGYEALLSERSTLLGAELDAEIGRRFNGVDLVILLACSPLHAPARLLQDIESARRARFGMIAIDCDAGCAPSALFTYVHADQVLSLTHAIIDPDDPFSATDLSRILEQVGKRVAD